MPKTMFDVTDCLTITALTRIMMTELYGNRDDVAVFMHSDELEETPPIPFVELFVSEFILREYDVLDHDSPMLLELFKDTNGPPIYTFDNLADALVGLYTADMSMIVRRVSADFFRRFQGTAMV